MNAELRPNIFFQIALILTFLIASLLEAAEGADIKFDPVLGVGFAPDTGTPLLEATEGKNVELSGADTDGGGVGSLLLEAVESAEAKFGKNFLLAPFAPLQPKPLSIAL